MTPLRFDDGAWGAKTIALSRADTAMD